MVTKKVKLKVAHTRLPSVGFRSWFRFLAVSLQVTWVINPAVGCHYFPPGPQLPSQPLRGLLSIWLLGDQRHNGCEQFAFPTASRLQFEPRPFCAWVQHANHSATEPPTGLLLGLLGLQQGLPRFGLEIGAIGFVIMAWLLRKELLLGLGWGAGADIWGIKSWIRAEWCSVYAYWLCFDPNFSRRRSRVTSDNALCLKVCSLYIIWTEVT